MLSKAIQVIAGAAGEETDPQFPYVTMLLHGDGTNGAQNNTFLDASANAFTITRNGNTTQGSFSPYGANWSNYFDGTGDYLRIADNTALDMGGSDFTMEFWINPQVSTSVAGQTVIGKRANASTIAGILVGYWNSNLYPTIYATFNGSSWGINALTSSIATPQGQWSHVAVTRNGSTWQIWVNGVQGATTTASGTVPDNASQFSIGATSEDGNDTIFKSYISNLRVVKGTAVYTGAFTPSTTPLTAISGTSLLTCQSNRFKDNSANNFTITRNGDVSVQRFSPFAPTAAYSTSVIGGSGYSDGAGDYLTAPATGYASYINGTGNFTIEFFVYYDSLPSSGFGMSWYAQDSGLAVISPFNLVQFNNTWRLWAATSSGGWDVFNDTTLATTSLTTHQWYHIACVKQGNNINLFVNGSLVGQINDGGVSYWTNTGYFFNILGRWQSPGSSGGLNGYISNYRLVKGTAVYTTNFTPPTAPLTAVTNTSLLLSMTNAGIYDNAMMADLETVGNAQISTSVKKYGTGSMAFDGSGDYLQTPISQLYAFGSGDFTVELWAYFNTSTVSKTLVALSTSNGTLIDTSNTGYIRANITVAGSDRRITGSQLAVTGQWYHIAFVRTTTVLTLYVDGVSVGTYAIGTQVADAVSTVSTVGSSTFHGYIDDLRITKGYARYTANFTPPTAAFPNL